MKLLVMAFLHPLFVYDSNYRVKCAPVDCATRVDECPTLENQWKEKNTEFECATGYGYVCMRDSEGYFVESCMANFTVKANTSDCPVLYDCRRDAPLLGPASEYFHCPEKEEGCPQKNNAYSIYKLYKYPMCIRSSVIDVEEKYSRTEPRFKSTITTQSMKSARTTPFTGTRLRGGENKIVLIIKVYLAIPLVVIGLLIGRGIYTCYNRLSSKKIRDLCSLIREINEAEACGVQVLPFKIDDKKYDKIDIDCIYVPVSMKEECETRYNSMSEKNISSINPYKMFNVQNGKPARFVFLLGEAGYGKTVQCQRIAKSWCTAWKARTNFKTNTDLERNLKIFEFLFFIRMRDVNKDAIHIEGIICDAYKSYHNDVTSEHLDMIRGILKDKRRRCLILLDGFDEWKYNSKIKNYLLHGCIPNYTDMPNCTILISMRSWKFIEVEPLFRGNFDRMITLKGLDIEDIKKLAEKMRRNYYRKDNNSDETDEEHSQQDYLQTRYDKLLDVVSSDSFELKSLLHIPLLTVFFILATFEGIEPGHSQTTFFLSVIEAFIKRSLRTKQIEQPEADISDKTVTGILQDYPLVTKYMPKLKELGKLAFESLTSKTSNLVFREIMLNKQLGEDTVDLFLRIGLVIKTETSGKLREDNMKISFLHKTIREFLASLYIYYGREENKILEIVKTISTNVDKALEYSPVLSFIAGLSPHVGCRISQLIKEMTTHDDDVKKYRERYHHKSYQKVFNLYNLQLRCYREVRGSQYITDSELKDQYKFSDVILLSSDTDIPTIRESAEVLKHHANDIVSLKMVCIPDNEEEGISNAEVKNFLDKSQSIESIYIDGYVNAKCRLFNEYSQRISRLKTLGLRNVAFRDNILADLITKKESIEGICVLGLLYIKSAEDEEIDFEYHIPSIHWIETTELGYKRKAFPKNTSGSSGSFRKQRTPLLRKLLEILPQYNVLKILHITYMEAEDDRDMLLQVLPELHQLESVGYSGSSIYPKPTCNHQYDTNVCSKIIQLENVIEVGLYSISLTTSVLNFEKIAKLKEISLECFTMHSADDWTTFFKSLSNNESLERIFLYDTDVTEDVSNEYKRSQSRHVSVEIK